MVNNQDIDDFFQKSRLGDAIRRLDHPPNVLWTFRAGNFPMLVQTQENVNRMRIVAFIGDASELDEEGLRTLLEANYHSALDARYALTDGQVVAAFLHPLSELTPTQFVLGLHQTVSCAETYGTTYSGGTLVFGAGRGRRGTPGAVEESIHTIIAEVVAKIGHP